MALPDNHTTRDFLFWLHGMLEGRTDLDDDALDTLRERLEAVLEAEVALPEPEPTTPSYDPAKAVREAYEKMATDAQADTLTAEHPTKWVEGGFGWHKVPEGKDPIRG